MKEGYMGEAQQKSFSFVKKLTRKKKEKPKPMNTAMVMGIRFDFYKEYNVGCGDCGALTMPFTLAYENGRCIARRCICKEESCLYEAALEFRRSR